MSQMSLFHEDEEKAEGVFMADSTRRDTERRALYNLWKAEVKRRELAAGLKSGQLTRLHLQVWNEERRLICEPGRFRQYDPGEQADVGELNERIAYKCRISAGQVAALLAEVSIALELYEVAHWQPPSYDASIPTATIPGWKRNTARRHIPEDVLPGVGGRY